MFYVFILDVSDIALTKLITIAPEIQRKVMLKEMIVKTHLSARQSW